MVETGNCSEIDRREPRIVGTSTCADVISEPEINQSTEEGKTERKKNKKEKKSGNAARISFASVGTGCDCELRE